MNVAIVTVGDEVLAGDTVNTNAAWLSGEITDRGGRVARVVVVPDDRAVIADAVRRWSEQFDAVVVTGGLGDTHDDVTMEGVADGLDLDLVVDDEARADVEETIAALTESHPELVEQYPEMSIDVAAQASIPEGARPLLNPVGLAPGCAAENAYVLPGIPEEMKATFGLVADEFGGDATSQALATPAPEGALADTLSAANDRFDVAVGSYPTRDDDHNRIKVSGTDPGTVERAVDWLRDRVEVVDDGATSAGEGS